MLLIINIKVMKMNISSLKITASSAANTIVGTTKKVISYASIDGYWSVGSTPLSKMIYTSFSDSTKLPKFYMFGVPPFVMIVPKEKHTNVCN